MTDEEREALKSIEKSNRRMAESLEKMLAVMEKPESSRKKIVELAGAGASIVGIFGIIGLIKNLFVGG